ncbi:MAG: hypothetical protein H6739_25465 [Alphaproteobacteria bacterium]|nr:hypothetical protein [Alphaproteobacteria bacterium]
MRRTATLLLISLAVACTGGDKDADDSGSNDDSGDGVDYFAEIVYLTTDYTTLNEAGVFACYTVGDAWLSQSPDSSCQFEAALAGEVEDFETGDNVEDPELQLFFNDVYSSGGADQTITGNTDGDVAGTGMTCTPTLYVTETDPGLGLTRTTIQSHNVWEPDFIGRVTFNSVSSATYNVIPSLLGVSVQSGMGIVAGTAYDCNGDPVEGVMVIGKDADGNYPAQSVRYFRGEFPNRDQEGTSEDGLWVAINLPPGDMTMEMWGWNGTEYVMLGSSTLTVVPDSINIASIYYGYPDGVVYPDDCLSACN